jgi:GT2 family glycosyltransferase
VTTCSIVIPVHNRAALTTQCLDILLSSPLDRVLPEIVVVDDASSDTTAQVLAARADRVRVVRHEQNVGFAGACNDGAAVATGEWLVFLNNDTLPQSGWLDALLRYASSGDRIGFVGSKLLFPNGTIQHAGVVFARDLTPHHIYTGFRADHPAVSKSREFQVVTGACAVIRRALFDQLGGFDAGFVNGYEDVDLCLRLRRLGYEVHYCHESVLYHLESATRDYAFDPQNHELFLERWAEVVHQDDIQYYLEDGLIDMTYWEQFPALLWVSPYLAVLDRERANAGEALLAKRSRQVYDALKENTRLRIELLEAEERARATSEASGTERLA